MIFNKIRENNFILLQTQPTLNFFTVKEVYQADCSSHKNKRLNSFYLGNAQERGVQLPSGFSQPKDSPDSSKAGSSSRIQFC